MKTRAGATPPLSPSAEKTQREMDTAERIRAIPEEDRTPRQQQILDRYDLGRPMVEVKVGENKEIANAMTLRREFSADQRVKNYRTAKEFVDTVNTSYQRAQTTKNKGPVDIALAKGFQKLTDIMSTVREGEFLTTFEGMRLWNKWKGKMQSYVTGGLGFTNQDRKEIRDLSNEILNSHKTQFNNAYDEFSQSADAFKLGPYKKGIFGGARRLGSVPPKAPGPTGKSLDDYSPAELDALPLEELLRLQSELKDNTTPRQPKVPQTDRLSQQGIRYR
jgi:hypothetical protein